MRNFLFNTKALLASRASPFLKYIAFLQESARISENKGALQLLMEAIVMWGWWRGIKVRYNMSCVVNVNSRILRYLNDVVATLFANKLLQFCKQNLICISHDMLHAFYKMNVYAIWCIDFPTVKANCNIHCSGKSKALNQSLIITRSLYVTF